MKIIVFTTIILLGAVVNTLAQSTDVSAVETAVEKLTKAMLDGDKAVLQALTATDLSYGHSSGTMEDKATFVEALASGKSDFTRIDITKQTVKISGNIALVRHELRGDVNGNPVNLGVLLVWQKDKKNWKLLARQAFKI